MSVSSSTEENIHTEIENVLAQMELDQESDSEMYGNILECENVCIQGKYIFTDANNELQIGENPIMRYYVVRVMPNRVYQFSQSAWWALTNASFEVLSGCGVNGNYCTVIDTRQFDDASYFFCSYSDDVSQPFFGGLGRPTIKSKSIDARMLSVCSYYNLLPEYADYVGNINEGYIYGVVGQPIQFDKNESGYSYYAVKAKNNTVYYFTKTRWWALTDETNVVLAGGGINGENIEESIDTSYYTGNLTLWLTFELGSDHRLVEGNNNVFCIPDFSLPVGYHFRFYTNNCCLYQDVLTKLSDFSGNQQYEDGYQISCNSERIRNYDLSIYDYQLHNQGVHTFTVSFKEKDVRNITALFIGDSTINQGMITKKAIDVFAENNATLTLLGQRGSGINRHQGISGWTAEGCWGKPTWGTDTPNHFYDETVGHFSFSYYISKYGCPTPDFVFIQFGINDLFSTSPFSYGPNYDKYFENLLNIINDIHKYDNNIKIVVNTILMPNENINKFGEMCGTGYYPWERRAMDIIANAMLSKDLPEFVIINPHHMVLDCSTMISDDVHPTEAGYEILGELDANLMFIY